MAPCRCQGALDSEQLHGMMSVLTCLESIYGSWLTRPHRFRPLT